jgi:repressor LexA
MTDRQAEIYQYLRDFVSERGFPPTLREICKHFGWTSTNAAAEHLRAIEKQQLIRIHERQARGIQILRGTDHGESEEEDREEGGKEACA